jgi:hypothetical protein
MPVRQAEGEGRDGNGHMTRYWDGILFHLLTYSQGIVLLDPTKTSQLLRHGRCRTNAWKPGITHVFDNASGIPPEPIYHFAYPRGLILQPTHVTFEGSPQGCDLNRGPNGSKNIESSIWPISREWIMVL